MTQTHLFKPWSRDHQLRIYIERIEPEGAPKPTTSLGYLDINRDTHEMTLVEMVDGSGDEMRDVVSRSLAITPNNGTKTADGVMGDPVNLQRRDEPEKVSAPTPDPVDRDVPVRIAKHAYTDLATVEPGASIRHLLDENKTYRQGFVGEQRTAGVLSALQNLGWKVLHSIPMSDAKDLDHLLIGPVGVLAINTKTSTYPIVAKGGSVTTNGYEQTWLDSIRRDADIATRLLTHAYGEPIEVRGVIVAWSSASVESHDVDVIDGMELIEKLRQMPVVLDQDWIDSIFDRARRDTTWSANID